MYTYQPYFTDVHKYMDMYCQIKCTCTLDLHTYAHHSLVRFHYVNRKSLFSYYHSTVLIAITFVCCIVVSVQAATLRIQGGSTVHVGDTVNITCTCDVTKCFQGVHFRINGVEYNFSTLEGRGVTNYNLNHTTDWSTLTFIYTLVLVNATVDDNGTTYQCTPSTLEGEGDWSNTETLTVLGELCIPSA